MAAGIKITLRGLAQVNAQIQQILVAVTGGSSSRGELHRRYGIQALNWINENFRRGGGLLSDGPWKPLAAGTIAARRRGSSQILQDTGLLRGSYTFRASSQEVKVGTENAIAKYHEYGTRGPYPIVPRNALALAFPAAGPGANVSRVRASFSSLATQKTFKRGSDLVIVKRVMHPGLVKRRTLPTEQELLPQLLRTTINWTRENSGSLMRGGNV